MAHKGKATSDVSFNLEDPPEAYTNPSVHSCISEYTEVAGRSMGQTMIRAPRTLMKRPS